MAQHHHSEYLKTRLDSTDEDEMQDECDNANEARKEHRAQPAVLTEVTKLTTFKFILRTTYRACYLKDLDVVDKSGKHTLGVWSCDNVDDGTTRFRKYANGTVRLCNRCALICKTFTPVSPEDGSAYSQGTHAYVHLRACDTIQVVTNTGNTPQSICKLGEDYPLRRCTMRKNKLTFTKRIVWNELTLDNMLHEELLECHEVDTEKLVEYLEEMVEAALAAEVETDTPMTLARDYVKMHHAGLPKRRQQQLATRIKRGVRLYFQETFNK